MDLLDTHTAIVGASGAGKTVTAKGHVETLLQSRRHVCIIDPTGAWWGLRSSADGEGPGFDIPIFGGPHGDVAITADQGEVIGAIIASGVSAIVDLSSLRTGSDQRRFARDLCRCLRTKPDGNFHLIVDEADEFAAQKPRDDYGFQVGEELIWMAKRGRLAGFVLTLVTQRPASIDKEVLTQAQTLIVHQLVAPVDQKPVLDYLRDHASKATLAEIKVSLASLKRGERWVYSPRLNVLERGVSAMPVTFDSSSTPAPGERAQEPKMLASIDLAEIRAALAPKFETIPPGTAEAAEADWTIERAEGQRQLDALMTENAALKRDRDFWKMTADRRMRMIENARSALIDNEVEEAPPQVERAPASAPTADTAPKLKREPAPSAGAMNASARKMLEMLEQISPARVSWAALASMVGNKPRGGNFNAARRAMRESGLMIEEGDTVRSVTRLAGGLSREEAIHLWAGVLTNPAPRMIAALADGPMTREQLGGALGVTPRGGHFNSGVHQLIRNGVAVDRAGVLHLAEPLPGESA